MRLKFGNKAKKHNGIESARKHQWSNEDPFKPDTSFLRELRTPAASSLGAIAFAHYGDNAATWSIAGIFALTAMGSALMCSQQNRYEMYIEQRKLFVQPLDGPEKDDPPLCFPIDGLKARVDSLGRISLKRPQAGISKSIEHRSYNSPEILEFVKTLNTIIKTFEKYPTAENMSDIHKLENLKTLIDGLEDDAPAFQQPTR